MALDADDRSYTEALERHYESAWSTPGQACWFDRGPIDQLPPSFRVCRFDLQCRGLGFAYATVGMSEQAQLNRTELHLFAPAPSDDHTELLYALAHYHCTSRPLGLGHTVNFGRGWTPGSPCTHGLVSRPYLDGQTLEQASQIGASCYWLLPIHESEREFKKRNGLDALETRFEAASINYLDPHRPPVA